MTTKEDIRKECEEAVSRPGKFEGEHIYTPYFYDVILNGEREILEENITTIEIEPEDREIFPEIPSDATRIILAESEQGFVHCETVDDNFTLYLH